MFAIVGIGHTEGLTRGHIDNGERVCTRSVLGCPENSPGIRVQRSHQGAHEGGWDGVCIRLSQDSPAASLAAACCTSSSSRWTDRTHTLCRNPPMTGTFFMKAGMPVRART